MIVDCGLYRDGRRVGGTLSIEEAHAHCGEADLVWVGLADPPVAEVRKVLAQFEMPTRSVETLVHHQERSRLVVEDHSLELVMRTARYLEEPEEVEFGQVSVVVHDRVVVVVRLGEVDDLRPVRAHLEDDPQRLATGPKAVLAALIDVVLRGYPTVLAGITDDIEEVEEVVFSDAPDTPTRRIYYLNRELLELRRAIGPLTDAIAQLADESRTRLTPEQALWFRDLADLAHRITQLVESNSELLGHALSANLTQVSIRQNEDMRKISAWAAMLALPTLVAGIYGMNFDHMPELDEPWAYPLVLALMALACYLLYRRFKRVHWL
ncbi:MAG TPA: magnesium and cobalt transport protein CorA [Microthrixaceae bacterium]|nr:magnesium and cobalt transport protein CorA [Microthrixaceae bacterium]